MKNKYSLFLIVIFIYMLFASKTFAQWEQIPQLDYHIIYCMLGTNDSTIFVGGDGGLLLRSTNSGSTWTDVMGNGFWVDTVLSLGKGLGYVFAGSNGAGSIFRSSDLGESWIPANNGLPSAAKVNDFAFIDSTLFAATSRGVYSSIDSGGIWHADTAGLSIPQYPDGSFGYTGIAAVKSKLYTIKFFSGEVYSSSIDTILWSKISGYYNSGFGIATVDTNIFIATQKGIYLYGGGTTWLPRNHGLPVSDTSGLAFCILTAEDSLLFASVSPFSQPEGIYVSSNLGGNWKRINDSVSSTTSITAIAANKDYLFAGTQSGGWRIPVGDLITSVDKNNYQFPGGFKLSQNYPNPFNPSTTIKFQIANSSLVSLRVYDILGREVSTLVNKEMHTGSYEITWNASDFSSGVYYYRLTSGTFSQTKKLLLLK